MEIKKQSESTAITAIAENGKFTYQLRYQIANKTVTDFNMSVMVKQTEGVPQGMPTQGTHTGSVIIISGNMSTNLSLNTAKEDRAQIAEDAEEIYTEVVSSL